MIAAGGPISFLRSIMRRLRGRRATVSESSVFLLNERILACECAADEIVLFDTESRGVYLLNHTAAAVIRLTDGARNLGWIARKIAWEFDAGTIVVTRDIQRIFRELMTKGVVTMAPDRTLIPKMKRETVIRTEDDGAFIFDPVTDALSAVNETGLMILKQIDGKKTLAEIINIVASEYSQAEPEEIGRDVEEFIEGLVSRGLIGA